MENEVEVSGCDVVYGLSHNISVNAPAFATVRYGTEEGNYPYTIPIPYVNSGRYTTYYCITAPHYQTITGSAIVNIAKANRSLEITSGNMTLNQGASGSILYSINKDADGSAKYAISFSNSNPSVASVDEYGVVTAKSAGTSIITVKLNETKNYNLAEPQEVLVTVIGNEVTMPEEYSIIYAPNGGAGEMPSTTAKNGELFIFPACTFTAPRVKSSRRGTSTARSTPPAIHILSPAIQPSQQSGRMRKMCRLSLPLTRSLLIPTVVMA